jgi:hypothetical protein
MSRAGCCLFCTCGVFARRCTRDAFYARMHAQTKAEVERAFGRPLADMFVSFDPRPLASGSIAQARRPACGWPGGWRGRGEKEALLSCRSATTQAAPLNARGEIQAPRPTLPTQVHRAILEVDGELFPVVVKVGVSKSDAHALARAEPLNTAHLRGGRGPAFPHSRLLSALTTVGNLPFCRVCRPGRAPPCALHGPGSRGAP